MKKWKIILAVVWALAWALACALTCFGISAAALTDAGLDMERYDVNGDGTIDISDVTSILSYLATECGHQTVTVDPLAPTCIAEGHTKRQYCAKCRADLIEYEVLPATGEHHYVDNQCIGCGIFQDSVGLNFTDEGIFYTVKDIGSCTDTTIVIPKEYNGKPVLKIGNRAFNNNKTIARVILPEGLTTIGDSAFYGCSALSVISFPESLTSIDASAFDSCTTLSSVKIPKSLKTVGTLAFYNCTGLQSVYISDLKSWCEIDFSYAKSNPLYYAKTLFLNDLPLEGTVTIPQGTTKICAAAFSGCDNVTAVVIPQSVTSVGSQAFRKCTSLREVYISDLKNWCEIDFPDSAATPLYYARKLFVGEDQITDTLLIPEGTTKIGDYAFMYLGISDVSIPSSVASIGKYAFYCSSLTELTVPGTVKNIGELAFYWSLQLKKASIGSGVTSIGRKAFSECSALSDIVVPVSVTTLGEAVFDRSLKLTDIYCEAASKPSAWNENWMGDCAASVHWGDTWEYIGNIPQMKEPEGSFSEGLSYVSNGNGTTCTLTGMGTCSDTDLVIPKTHNGMTVTAIGDWAFEISSCYTELGAVELSNSITTIGMGAFDHQTFLRKVTLSENLTDIESNAFAYTGLSKIVIPKSVTYIGANAFLGCSDLKNIYLESETVPDSWDAAWLGNCSAAIHLGNEWEYVNGVPTLK